MSILSRAIQLNKVTTSQKEPQEIGNTENKDAKDRASPYIRAGKFRTIQEFLPINVPPAPSTYCPSFF
jgi:hypothetical protein